MADRLPVKPFSLPLAAVYLLAWYGLDIASQRFSTSPDVTVWYPAVALDVALLMVFGLRYWPLLIVSRLIHEYLVVEPLPLPYLLAYVFGTALIIMGGVWLLNRLRANPRLPHLRDVALFVAVAMFAMPLVLAALQVLNVWGAGLLQGRSGAVQMMTLWAGTATGVGLLAPPLLIALRRWPGVWDAPAPDAPPDLPETPLPPVWWREALEWLGDALLVGAALWIGYGQPRGDTLNYSYVLFVPLLWIAARHGFERAALGVLILNVGVALLSSAEVRQNGGLVLQFGLLTVTVSGLLLGAVVRERAHLIARLRFLALHDPLTDLGNRRLFGERVEGALGAALAPGSVAVLLLDFDNFKAINDSLGHSVGDEVLVAVSQRLRQHLPPRQTLARLGGDEFAVLLENVISPDAALSLAGKLLEALAKPVAVQGEGGHLDVAASLGVALAGPEAQDAGTLLRNADVALYEAKAHRRGQAQLFDAPMHAALLSRLELERELRQAILDGSLEVYYQPLVDTHSGELRGVEALVRWPHPRLGLLSPATFIGLAEETGLIVPLDRWVLRTAAREVASWPTANTARPLHLGVNLSAVHVQSPGTVSEISAALSSARLAPERLMLELTENVLMSSAAATVETLRSLRRLGIRLALDDFGTGYSSLSYLQQFPISDLKVDRAFIADLGQGTVGTELARAVAVMGKALNLDTVAEGVETPSQFAQVRALGYTLAQGYFISPPLPADQARQLAASAKPLVQVERLEEHRE